MSKRHIDRTKKSNIKCQHSQHWHKDMNNSGQCKCEITNEYKNYWNRCTEFKWEESEDEE